MIYFQIFTTFRYKSLKNSDSEEKETTASLVISLLLLQLASSARAAAAKANVFNVFITLLLFVYSNSTSISQFGSRNHSSRQSR